MARPAQELGWYFQTGSSLPDRLSELAMLLIGRLWLADYVWRTHLPRARRAGLSEAVIAALGENRPPEFSAEDERLVYDFVTRLHAERALDDQLYARAVRLLGRDGIIDLTGLVGYFSLIAMTIKVFEA
jgi:4-carboxymuconolactone decarboxylase